MTDSSGHLTIPDIRVKEQLHMFPLDFTKVTGNSTASSSACTDVVARMPDNYDPSDEEVNTERGWRLKGRNDLPPLPRAFRENQNAIGGIDTTVSIGLIVDRELQGHPRAQNFFQ